MEEKQTPSTPQKPRPFAGAKKEWKFVVGFLVFSALFFAGQFAYQYYVLIPGEYAGSVVRSTGIAGATFFGLALLLSAIFKWKPKYARYWHVRRSLGVMGLLFVIFHVSAVTNFFFEGDISRIWWSLNPLENPLLFGAIAYPIFFLMAITSFDWAVQRMGFPKWKALHRLVYFGYYAAVFHFIAIDPELFSNAAGAFLLIITFLAVAGQLYWFIHSLLKRKSSGIMSLVAIIVIFLWLFLVYTVAIAPVLMEHKEKNGTDAKLLPTTDLEIKEDVKKMIEDMEKNPPPEPPGATKEEKEMTGTNIRTGEFENLNYMSSGGVTLTEVNGNNVIIFGDDFTTPNGPDLVVYLTKNSDPSKRDDVANGIRLGELKSLNGKQVYTIPQGTILEDFNSVTIHCRAFNVPWSYAPIG